MKEIKFKNLSDWIMVEHCATRIVKGGNVDNIADRVAFIEKTPRVKMDNSLRKNYSGLHYFGVEEKYGGTYDSNIAIWIYGYKGSSDYGLDENSRAWCDEMLKSLGWEVEDSEEFTNIRDMLDPPCGTERIDCEKCNAYPCKLI